MSDQLFHVQDMAGARAADPTALLPEATYAAALDHLVIGCVDLVFTHQHQVLLAQRRRHPHPHWWMIGGRMSAGESPVTTACRKAEQEAGLTLTDTQRFHYLGTFSTYFARRHQEPQEGGLHSLNVTYQVELTASEQATLRLCEAEYADWRWLTHPEIERMLPVTTAMDRLLFSILTCLNQPEPQ